MELIFLATSIVTSSIVFIILFTLFKDIKISFFEKKEIPLILLGLTYLIFTLSLFLWAINIFTFNTKDFLIMYSLVLIAQTFCLLTIIYKIRQNKKIFYALLPLLLSILSSIFLPHLAHLIIPTSLFIIMLAFLSETLIQEKVAKYLLLYTSLSLFFYLFALLWQNTIPILNLISNILFLLFLIPFLKFLKLTPHKKPFSRRRHDSPIVQFLKHFIFIVIMTNFIFIGTISVHEFGHLIASSQSNCENTKTVYELGGLPHTEIKCEDLASQNLWILGGPLLPIFLAFFLFFSGGKFIKEIAVQITGFNFMISYLDIKALGFSSAIATFILIVGISLVVFSLALLAKSRID